MPAETVRVVYILGTGRSGSTLLANILGQVPGFTSAGEVRYLWQRGLLENRLCGCGERFADCPHWRRVLELAFPAGPPDAAAAAALQANATRVRRLPALLARPERLHRGPLGEHLESLSALYRALAAASGAEVVVDSSKLPAYARLLAEAPGVDLQLVHLVRDPRGAAHSWRRLKEQPDRGFAGFMETQSPAHSALLWSLWNATAEAAFASGRHGAYLQLRYEDFSARPREVVEAIVRAVLPGAADHLPFTGPSTVRLGPTHTVAGNPDRLKQGEVTIRAETGWKATFGGVDAAVVTALTLPGLLKYRYGVRAREKAAAEPIGIQHLPGPVRTLKRLQRHWRWGREEGFGRLVEEDELDPRQRLALASRRRAWRRRNPLPAGSATPVYLVGLQRSGTNMVARALAANPEFEVRNESDRAVFDRFRLRPDAVVREVVRRSRHRFLVLKPLIDSDRVIELLDGLGAQQPGRAIWTYRSVDGRVRSALSKFGDNNLRTVEAIQAGRPGDVWQARGASAETLEAVRAARLGDDPLKTAGALIWWLRNRLFFDLGLDRRDDVLLVCYDRLVRDPEPELRRVGAFLGAAYQPEMAEGIGVRGGGEPRPLEIDPGIRQLCDALERRLEEACAAPTRR